ncbi:MAG: TetR/AcrR family transcriptional regulator [Acidimicrobiales bacterium]|nr:TetR/AcrR family transcriptional regulator [Acidimicrobiales bacterium]
MTPKAVSSGHPSHDDDRTTEGAQIRREVGRAGAPAQGRELRSRGKQTMRRLLDAGIEVFARRGFHAARVDDIVKAAKTSHGTFYLYFANKEDLFEALVADVAEEMRGLADSLGPLRAGPEGRAELRAWLERFTTLYEHYGPILRTWTEAEIDQSELGRIGTDLLGQLALALSERVAATGAKGLDPAIAGLALVAMVERFNYFVLSGQVSADHDELLDTLASVLHDGLFSR